MRLLILLSRVLSPFRRRRLDAALDDEVLAHLDLLAAEHMRRGMSPEAARLAARRDFGGVEQMKEIHRDRRGLRWLDDAQRDVRYAVRSLVRDPGFTAVAVLSLGLGIGANAAIFGLIDAVLLKSLPVHAPEELVIFAERRPGPSQNANHNFSYELFQTFRRENRSLADVVASASTRMSIDIAGVDEPTTQGQLVSGTYYAMLGVGAALGRVIARDDDEPAGRAVAVLSHAYWQRRFGADPTVVGRTVRVNGYPFTIIGVSSPGFLGTRVGTPADITVPLTMQEQVMPQVGGSWIRDPYQFWLQILGRRDAGVPVSQAQADLAAIHRRHLDQLVANADGSPKWAPLRNARLELEVGGRGLSELRDRYSRPLAVLMGVVVLVLLAACANVANLLLARAMARRPEIALRMSLGAGTARLIRQLLTESLVIAVLSGGVGLLIAVWSSVPGALLVGESLTAVVAGPDVRVLLFTFAASLLTGVLFGLAPALMLARADPQRALKDDERGGTGRRTWGQALLVSAQVAISLTLLVGAGLFVRTLMNLRTLDLGIDQEHVLTLRLEPEGSNQKQERDGRFKVALMRTYSELIERVESVPGVRSASLAGITPLGNENSNTPEVLIPAYAPKPGESMRVRMLQIYPNYFATLGTEILVGRDLTAVENQPAAAVAEPRVAVINDTMARRFFGGAAAALGRRFTVGSRQVFEIVGVAKDVRDQGPREEVLPAAYASYTQTPTGRGQMTLVVRTAGDPHGVASTIRSLARSIDPNMPLLEMRTVSEHLDTLIAQERLVALLSSLFGAVALLLASIGLYGVMAYAVTRRRIEFGVRMALGATRRAVVGMVLKESLWLVSAGIVIGLAVALAASQLIASRLFGVSAADPLTFAGAMLLLMIVAVVATLLPARRAAKVEPMLALRDA